MSTLLQDHPPVKEAYEKYRQFNSDKELRALDEAHQKFLHDQATKVEAARKDGEDKGIIKGKIEEKNEIAQNMKNKGCDFDFIAEMTGLSINEIEKLN